MTKHFEEELNKALYRKVYLIRKVEEKIREIYHTDVMKTPVHLSVGEEAIAAGVCQALKPDDQIYGTYRNHGIYLAKGGDLGSFFAELYGKKTGAAKGKAGSMHISYPEVNFYLSSAIVASIIPVALGAAFASQYHSSNRIIAVFFGDGATEEGVFWESVNFASLKKLPVLFVCEDNGLAIHAHKSARQSYEIADVVKQFRISTQTSDSTDPHEIYKIAETGIHEMELSKGPHFLHLKYHRYLEHVGVNEDYCHGYRNKEDYAGWYEVDPVDMQRKRLIRSGVSVESIRTIEIEIEEDIEKCIKNSFMADFPDPTELYMDIYK